MKLFLCHKSIPNKRYISCFLILIYYEKRKGVQYEKDLAYYHYVMDCMCKYMRMREEG